MTSELFIILASSYALLTQAWFEYRAYQINKPTLGERIPRQDLRKVYPIQRLSDLQKWPKEWS